MPGTRRTDYALAAASGALLAGSFPSFGAPAVAWIALAPLLLALGSGSLRHGFLLGLTTGLVYFAGTLYWITEVMHQYGGLQSWTAVIINLLLVLYQGAFLALFGLTMRYVIRGAGARGVLATPLVWVSMELGRTFVFSGFPWVLLGYSQASVLPIAQLASLLGVYGVSALVALVSAALVYAWAPAGWCPPPIATPVQPLRRGQRLVPLLVACALVLLVGVWGSRRVARAELTTQGEPVTVGLVQGNVEQGEKWDAARASAIFRNYLRLTREAVAGGARLVVWPESSTPFFFEEDKPAAEEIRAIARESGAAILLGSDQIQRGQPNRYYNSAFMVGADGSTAGVYQKMHLVPFGEFVPMKSLLFFAAPLVEAVSDFSSGLEQVLLPVGAHPVSTAICYEVVYPALVRDGVARGSQLLTTITNDAWFGRTSAPYQHFAQASMRAIENGRYLVRAANTGISGIVDPYGRVLAQSHIFEPAVVVGEARYLRALTFYTRTGDVFAYAALAATAGLLVAARRRVQ